jgi:hypothetical protein
VKIEVYSNGPYSGSIDFLLRTFVSQNRADGPEIVLVSQRLVIYKPTAINKHLCSLCYTYAIKITLSLHIYVRLLALYLSSA